MVEVFLCKPKVCCSNNPPALPVGLIQYPLKLQDSAHPPVPWKAKGRTHTALILLLTIKLGSDAAEEGMEKRNDLLNQERMKLLTANINPPEQRQYAELAELE